MLLQLLAVGALLGNGRETVKVRAPDASRRPVHGAAMARIPAGSYRPLYAMAADAPTRVTAFSLDREPVTRGNFLTFVRANPVWRRSAVRRELADRGYLANWRGDLDAGDTLDLERPVTAVSRFAAAAYCASSGKRLPTADEWEYAAAASETVANASSDPRFVSRLLDLYARRPSGNLLPPVGTGFRNVYGVRDLHGGAWEWTDDRADPTLGTMSAHMPSCASAAIGADDQSNYPAFLRYAFRAALTNQSTVLTLGFRCVAG